MNNSIIPIIAELERIYDALAVKFNISFPKPIITVQSKGRQKVLGWHWKEKWECGDVSVNEINICAEELKNNPIETLVHELAHHANACEKIEDCNSQQYHNKEFKKRAESYSLNVERAGRHGWALTSLSDNLKKIIEEIKPNEQVFKMYRKNSPTIVAPTKMKKFSCGCTTIRCAVDLQAQCLKCQKNFEAQE